MDANWLRCDERTAAVDANWLASVGAGCARMSRYGKRWRIALVLLVLLALAGCGPRVPDLTTGATPAGTAGGTGGGGTGAPGPTTGPNTEPSSPSGPASSGKATEPSSPSGPASSGKATETDVPTGTASPTESGTESPSTTATGTPPIIVEPPIGNPSPSDSTTPPTQIQTINCTSDVPASPATQATGESSSLPPNDSSTEKPDLSLADPQTCAVGVGKPPETAACLFVWVDVRSQGQGIPSVQVEIKSASLAANVGLNEERTLEAAPEPKPTEVRLNIQPGDLGRTHEVTFTADPRGAIEETDENNNAIAVNLNLPTSGTLPVSAGCPGVTPAPQGGGEGSTSPAPSTESAVAGG
jgi:hypothetical protein